MFANAFSAIAALVVVVIVAAAVLGLTVLLRAVKIVQQGSVGVVKRLGEFKSVRQPGLHILVPFMDRMEKVDMREFPQIGDKQAVITKDNVSLMGQRTIFCQVIDVKSALFEINDFQLAVDQLSLTAAAGRLRRDDPRRVALSARDDQHSNAGSHGRRHHEVGRASEPDRDPRHHPATNVLQAMSEQKEAEQHKRARSSSPKATSRRRSTRHRGTSKPPSWRPKGTSRPRSWQPRPK